MDKDSWHNHIDERFDKIETRLDELAEKKQDKLPKGLIGGVITTIVLQIIMLAFMYGTQMERLENVTDDRYRGTEAARDFALRDQRDANMETDILKNEVTIKELQQRLRALERQIGSE